MSYVIDVYRGDQAAIRNPVDYALFLSFFPKLTAGPIVRTREFIADLAGRRAPSSEEWRRGGLLLIFGLTKKVALADQFALIADNYFKDVAAHTGRWTAMSGVFAFAMQVFFDFVRLYGHGDRHGASSRFSLQGEPSPALSLAEHRRVLAALAHLFFQLAPDYIWFPLGGNRRGPLATYRNLMVTMLLAGLWHGASWNFVIWGGWHGALLSAEHAAGVRRGGHRHRWLAPLRVLLTFVLVCVGWVFFRARNLADAAKVLQQIVLKGGGLSVCPPWLLWSAAGTLLLAVFEERYGWFEQVVRGPAWVYAVTVAVLLFAAELLAVTDTTVPFVYFRF